LPAFTLIDRVSESLLQFDNRHAPAGFRLAVVAQSRQTLGGPGTQPVLVEILKIVAGLAP
jgi:hypothetical protein